MIKLNKIYVRFWENASEAIHVFADIAGDSRSTVFDRLFSTSCCYLMLPFAPVSWLLVAIYETTRDI